MGEIQFPHGGNLAAAARRYGFKPEQFLDFSANINPLGMSPLAREAIRQNLAAVEAYPDPECRELKDTVAAYLNVPAANLLPGNGTAELIFLLLRQLRPRRGLVPAPTFSEYARALASAGAFVEYLYLDREKGFRPEPEKIAAALAEGDILFLCNPNNPTGTLLAREEVVFILDEAERRGAFVVVDEAFMDFLDRRPCFSVVPEILSRTNLFVLYSLTKFFALPGLRLGIGIGPVSLIEALHRHKDPWNVNALAQIAGVYSLRDTDYIRRTRELLAKEKQFLYRELSRLPGFKPWPPTANYIFIDISASGFTSPQLRDLLGQRGILIRDCSNYAGLNEYYIRVAVKDRAANEKLLHELKEILEV